MRPSLLQVRSEAMQGGMRNSAFDRVAEAFGILKLQKWGPDAAKS